VARRRAPPARAVATPRPRRRRRRRSRDPDSGERRTGGEPEGALMLVTARSTTTSTRRHDCGWWTRSSRRTAVDLLITPRAARLRQRPSPYFTQRMWDFFGRHLLNDRQTGGGHQQQERERSASRALDRWHRHSCLCQTSAQARNACATKPESQSGNRPSGACGAPDAPQALFVRAALVSLHCQGRSLILSGCRAESRCPGETSSTTAKVISAAPGLRKPQPGHPNHTRNHEVLRDDGRAVSHPTHSAPSFRPSDDFSIGGCANRNSSGGRLVAWGGESRNVKMDQLGICGASGLHGDGSGRAILRRPRRSPAYQEGLRCAHLSIRPGSRRSRRVHRRRPPVRRRRAAAANSANDTAASLAGVTAGVRYESYAGVTVARTRRAPVVLRQSGPPRAPAGVPGAGPPRALRQRMYGTGTAQQLRRGLRCQRLQLLRFRRVSTPVWVQQLVAYSSPLFQWNYYNLALCRVTRNGTRRHDPDDRRRVLHPPVLTASTSPPPRTASRFSTGSPRSRHSGTVLYSTRATPRLVNRDDQRFGCDSGKWHRTVTTTAAMPTITYRAKQVLGTQF